MRTLTELCDKILRQDIDDKMIFKIFCRYDMIYMCIEIII